jgi:hypothetical protein
VESFAKSTWIQVQLFNNKKKERGVRFSPSQVKLVELLLSYCFLAVFPRLSHAFLVEGVAYYTIGWSH